MVENNLKHTRVKLLFNILTCSKIVICIAYYVP